MNGDGPPTLPYAAAEHRAPTRTAFVGGSVVLTVAFFIAAVVVETPTSHVLLYQFQILGPSTPGSLEEYRLQKREFGNLMIEYVWAFPAAGTFAVAVSAVRPRRGFRLTWQAVTVTILGSVAYSWVRWGFTIGHVQ